MRVLLLDEGFISGMVAARGLRSAGCQVDVIAATGGRGRCTVDRMTWSLAPRVPDPALLDHLDAAVARGRYDVVYPITEPLQWLLWDRTPAWAIPIFPSVEPHLRACRRDKRRMSELARQAGADVPRELPAATWTDVSRAVAELGLPIVIKGSVGRGGDTTRICDSADAAWRAAQRLAKRGVTPFAQEYVDGPTVLAGGLFDRGRPLRFFAGIKTAQVPPRTGPAAEVVSLHDPALLETATRVFAQAEVTGLASIDFVRDGPRRYLFLELNPRPWGSMQAAVNAGVDLFEPLVRLWRCDVAAPLLEFEAGVRTPIFPLCLLAPAYWRSIRALRASPAELRRILSAARTEPGFAGHIVHRLVRVGLNW